MKAIIKGTGSTFPDKLVTNQDFVHHHFYEKTGKKNDKPTTEIVAKLESITGIRERRYVPDGENSVPLMASASAKAIADAGIHVNDLHGIILCQLSVKKTLYEQKSKESRNFAKNMSK